MQARNIFRPSRAGAMLVSGALLWQGCAWGQGAFVGDDDYASDSSFDTPQWMKDDYGWYDRGFDWKTDDPGYEQWNDTDPSAWSRDDAEPGRSGANDQKDKSALVPLPPAPQSQKVDREQIDSTPRMVVGIVVDWRHVEVDLQPSVQHRLVKLEIADGSTAVVYAGTALKAEGTLNGMQKGDRIIAIGRTGRINGLPVLFAHSLGELYSTGVTSSRTASSSQSRRETD